MGNEKQMVESILFSAGHPVSIKDIREATGFSHQKIRKILKQLMEEYADERDTAMEIVKAGEKYAMQVKPEYVNQSFVVTDPDIDGEVLKTLSLIAFHQPLKQSNLRRMAGPKIYEHVDKLAEMKLIHTKKHRNTEMLTLTKYFPEYFGISTTDPEEIRRFLAEKIVEEVTHRKNQ